MLWLTANALLAFGTPVSFCECASATVDQAFRDADAVFQGETMGAVMAQAASFSGVLARALSFKAALQLLNAYHQLLRHAAGARLRRRRQRESWWRHSVGRTVGRSRGPSHRAELAVKLPCDRQR